MNGRTKVFEEDLQKGKKGKRRKESRRKERTQLKGASCRGASRRTEASGALEMGDSVILQRRQGGQEGGKRPSGERVEGPRECGRISPKEGRILIRRNEEKEAMARRMARLTKKEGHATWVKFSFRTGRREPQATNNRAQKISSLMRKNKGKKSPKERKRKGFLDSQELGVEKKKSGKQTKSGREKKKKKKSADRIRLGEKLEVMREKSTFKERRRPRKTIIKGSGRTNKRRGGGKVMKKKKRWKKKGDRGGKGGKKRKIKVLWGGRRREEEGRNKKRKEKEEKEQKRGAKKA